MSLDEFKDLHAPVEVDEDKDARPRLSEDVHEKVQEFTEHAGITNAESYNLILTNVLENEDLLCDVINEECEDIEVEDLSDHHHSLLEDIADLTQILGEFPSRREINNDGLCFGFPVYIMHFGSKENLIDALEIHYPSIYENADL